MQEKQSLFIHKISKIISNFFNPLISLFIFFAYMSIQKSFKDSLFYFLPILLMVVVPSMIWITWNVKTGKYTNMDVSNRIQRKTLYIFVVPCIIIYLIFNYIKNGNIDLIMLFALILLIILQISNFYIKSSVHVAFNIFFAALFFELNWKIGIIWLGIAILVGITRVVLKRHTIGEVFMGAGIAFVVSFIYLYCSIQSLHYIYNI